MEGFITKIGRQHFIVYMQEFGGPIGFRVAVDHPKWVDGLIVQNVRKLSCIS